MPLFSLQLPLPTFILVLIVARLRVVDVQLAGVARIVVVADLHSVAGQVNCGVDGRFERESDVTKVLLGQPQRGDFAAALEDFVDNRFGDVLGQSAHEARFASHRPLSRGRRRLVGVRRNQCAALTVNDFFHNRVLTRFGAVGRRDSGGGEIEDGKLLHAEHRRVHHRQHHEALLRDSHHSVENQLRVGAAVFTTFAVVFACVRMAFGWVLQLHWTRPRCYGVADAKFEMVLS